MAVRFSVLAGFVVAGLAACSQGSDLAPPTAGEVAVAVAPLELPGVTDATYDLLVVNDDDQVVWQRTVTSSQFGDGAGSVSYVGPCDADSNPNEVSVTLTALRDASGPLAAGSWVVPPTMTRAITCEANADVSVVFDLTVARAANQGFFDVAVELDDVFCSAKLDCGETTAPEDDIELLFDGPDRAMTAILGFACTPGVNAGDDAHVYLDDLTITCEDGSTTVVSVGTPGNVDLDAAPNANPSGYLFAASVFRGSEALASKIYWNVALGLDADVFATVGECTLTTSGTASEGPFTGSATPEGRVYPYIHWDLPLSDAARLCTTHEVDGTPGGVETRYTDGVTPRTFDHVLSFNGPVVPQAPSIFDYGGTSAQSLVVPSGATTMWVKAWGAGGGSGGEPGYRNSDGGAGGFVEAVVPVTGGEILTVLVGGAGVMGVEDDTAVGGYGGGGSTYGSAGYAGGGAGGGLSGVFRGTVDQAGALVIAGGGGGGVSANGYGGTGGTGGGADGTAASAEGFCVQAGGAATTTAAGVAGASGGDAGGALQGGDGYGAYIAGGGGGGYWGGGGGGWTAGDGGGGGGGAGFVVAGATSVTTLAGAALTPPRSSDPDYAAGVGVGGDGGFGTGQDGGHGRVVVRFDQAPSSPAGVCTPGKQSFTYVSGPVAFTVPAGCATLTVKAWGAGGGSGGEPGYTDSNGGAGGYAEGTFSATPGELLLVWVGGGGLPGVENIGPYRAFGGGGRSVGSSNWAGGGAGGGLSGVFRGGPTQADALVIAGGGGGGISANGSDAPGGAGGGAAGVDGGERSAGQGGGGGDDPAGQPGAAGGNGGSPGQAICGGAGHPDYIGGAGGGGYWGGGGGGWTGSQGGGGGGGSGYLASGVTGTLSAGSGTTPPNTGDADYQSGVGEGALANIGDSGRQGNSGLVVISWAP